MSTEVAEQQQEEIAQQQVDVDVQQLPKKKRSKPKKSADGTSAAPKRSAPGVSLIRAEKERLKRSLENLINKRKNAEEKRTSKDSPAPITCCVLMRDGLIDFFQDTLSQFEHRFGRYSGSD